MANNKDFWTILLTVIITVLVCNLVTPWLYNHVPTDRYRTTLILNKLKEPNLNSEIVVFGSSEPMSGIDGYQMSKELKMNVYNFSSTGQPQEESSLYYTKLPSSTKAVVQVIYPPIIDKEGEDAFNTIGRAIETAFIMGGYTLDDETQRLNSHIDLKGLRKNKILANFDARGAIVIPGLTYLLLPRNKKAFVDLKFCNSDLTEQHPMYQRTLDQAAERSMIGVNLKWDEKRLAATENYAKFLRNKGIKMVIVLMPKNPDSRRFSNEQIAAIGKVCKEGVPDATVLNYLNAISDTKSFYDAEHLNHKGARLMTSMLAKDLLKNFQ